MTVVLNPDATGFVMPLEIDPYRSETWPSEARRNHRLRRALHELMPSPAYRLEVGLRPDGTEGIRLIPAESVSVEAKLFLTQYREELITHIYWLREIDEGHGVIEDVPLAARG